MKNLGYLMIALTLMSAANTFDLCSFCVFKKFRAGPKYTICAANGKTYKNGCFAWCNKTRVVHPGACNVNHNPCDCPTGRDNYSPVCSFDGETFDNICIARCHGKDSSNSDFCLVSSLSDNLTNNHFPDMEGSPLNVREDLGNEKKQLVNQHHGRYPNKWPQGWRGINRVDKYNSRHSANYQGLLNVPQNSPGQVTQFGNGMVLP